MGTRRHEAWIKAESGWKLRVSFSAHEAFALTQISYLPFFDTCECTIEAWNILESRLFIRINSRIDAIPLRRLHRLCKKITFLVRLNFLIQWIFPSIFPSSRHRCCWAAWVYKVLDPSVSSTTNRSVSSAMATNSNEWFLRRQQQQQLTRSFHFSVLDESSFARYNTRVPAPESDVKSVRLWNIYDFVVKFNEHAIYTSFNRNSWLPSRAICIVVYFTLSPSSSAFLLAPLSFELSLVWAKSWHHSNGPFSRLSHSPPCEKMPE